jgi:uncharacterized SAM-dependent methyltransferase
MSRDRDFDARELFLAIKEAERLRFINDVKAVFRKEDARHLAAYKYAGKGSNYWDNARHVKSYALGYAESLMLPKVSKNFYEIIGDNSVIIDLGPGTSVNKTLDLLSKFENISEYIALDKEFQYANESKEIIRKNKPNLLLQAYFCDFLSGRIYLNFERENPVIVFLGGTIGNIPEERGYDEPHNLINQLKNFREMIKNKGSLIITHQSEQNVESLTRAYNNPEFAKFTLQVMHRVKEELPIKNFDPNLFEFEMEWDARDQYVGLYVKATEDQPNVVLDGEHINTIKKGERFIITYTYKRTPKQFAEILDIAGWENIKNYTVNGVSVHLAKTKKFFNFKN